MTNENKKPEDEEVLLEVSVFIILVNPELGAGTSKSAFSEYLGFKNGTSQYQPPKFSAVWLGFRKRLT